MTETAQGYFRFWGQMLCHNVPCNGLIPLHSTHNLWAKFSVLPSEQPKWDPAHRLDCCAHGDLASHQDGSSSPSPASSLACIPLWPWPTLHIAAREILTKDKSDWVAALHKNLQWLSHWIPRIRHNSHTGRKTHKIRPPNFLLLSSQWSLRSSHSGLPAGLQTPQASPSHPSLGVFSAARAQTAHEHFLFVFTQRPSQWVLSQTST